MPITTVLKGLMSDLAKKLTMNDEAHLAPLCDVCQTLDLSKTDNREAAKYELGTWEDVKRKAEEHPRCPSCVLLRSFTKRTKAKWYESGEAHIKWKAEGGFFFSTEGDNVAFLSDGTAKSPYGYARPVRSTIDPALIKKWMKLCEVHHEETCRPKHGVIKTAENEAGVKVLRVIDTEKQCIVEAVPGVRYLALSYVWGPVIPSIRLQKDNVVELSTKGSLTRYQQQFPKTINDAINLVRLIGERYLWVDSLCLIQDDDDDMLDGISHMDLVYQCAALTIIAAHGADANAGLPGLYPGSRDVEQEIIEVLPGIKMAATIGVYNALDQTEHSSRGWTMQELILSHRTLIFTKDGIYYRCHANCWSEDTIYDNFPSAVNKVLHSGSEIRFLVNNESEPIPAYKSQLFRYADRKLTKESDTIHGLTGILRFLSVQARSGLLEGLFTACFDISLLFWDNYPGVVAAGRRGGFPSWSWAGWCGIRDGYSGFCQSHEDVNSWLQTMTYIVWYKRGPETANLELVWDLDSQLKYGEPEKHHIAYRTNSSDPYGRTVDGSLENLRTRPDDEDIERTKIICQEMTRRQYHFLQFFAHVVFIHEIADPDRTVESWELVYKLLSADGMLCGGIRLDDPTLLEGVQGPHELILLSKMDRFDDFFGGRISFERAFYWVMLIEWQGEEKVVAERRGIGFLFQDRMEHVLHPGKVWKEIVLA